MKVKFDKRTAKIWSRSGQRAAFGLAIQELENEYKNLMVLTADVSTSAGLSRFKVLYPDKYLDVGIAEQNMMGIATGLSSEGYCVVTATFAPFQTMRCLEQIRVNQGYMDQKVIMVGLASGMVLGTLGNTHCCFEDIGVLRSIPNIDIISPADCYEVGKVLEASLQHTKSVYIRLTGDVRQSMVYTNDYNYEIGKGIFIKEPEEKCDIVIIANGTMVKEAMDTAILLESKGIKASIINMHTIKPIDANMIKEIAHIGYIVTIEEHSIYGGLYSAVSEVVATINEPIRIKGIGIEDFYPKPATYEDMLYRLGLKSELIAERIIRELRQ